MRRGSGRTVVMWTGVMMAALLLPGHARSDELAEATRGMVERYGDSVVTLKVVAAAGDREHTYEAQGTVLDASGLIVASNLAVDPFSHYPGADSEIKSVSLIREDGTELPLERLLRDEDLDLLFLRPEAEEGEEVELSHIEAGDEGADLELAEQVVVLSRLGPTDDREHAVLIGRVQAIITRPRKMYVVGMLGGVGTMGVLGSPVFDTEGRPVGIMVVRHSGRDVRGQIGRGQDAYMAVVLPIAEMSDGIKQAKGEDPDE